MNFEKITIIDPCGLTTPVLEQIRALSKQPLVIYDSLPADNAEILSRIADSDGVLVSWRTKVDAEVIKTAPNVKYIGMCCSLDDENAANVDIAQAR